MILKPQDVLVVLKLVTLEQAQWTYNELAVDLSMSSSEVHAAVKRSITAHLLTSIKENITVNKSALKEFLCHGLKYVFVPERGEMTRGMPTIYNVPPLNGILLSSDEPCPIWPDPMGETRGTAFSPLYKSVPKAARKDQELYALLSLVDAIRGGRAREKEMAVHEIRRKLE